MHKVAVRTRGYMAAINMARVPVRTRGFSTFNLRIAFECHFGVILRSRMRTQVLPEKKRKVYAFQRS